LAHLHMYCNLISSATLSATVKSAAQARYRRAWAKATADDRLWKKGLPPMDGLPPLPPPGAAPHPHRSLMPLSSSSSGSPGLNTCIFFTWRFF
jgi:hypothetical protein